MKHLLPAALLLAAAPLAACDSGGGATCADPTAAPAVTCPGGASLATYPAGPFGTAEGAILQDLTFVAPDGSSLSLSDLRAKGNRRVLLINTAADWCSACQKEQPFLQDLYESYGCDGLQILVTHFEDSQYQPSTASVASNWVKQHGLTFPVVADPDFQFEPYYNTELQPMNMVVNLCTMEIVKIISGEDIGFLEALIASQL